MTEVTVTALAVAPVKAMRLIEVASLEIEPDGARGDRRLYVVDDRDRMVNGKQHGALQTIVAALSADESELTLTFPDGAVVSGAVAAGRPITTRFYRRTDETHELAGPFSSAVSEFVGAPLRLVLAPRRAPDRGRQGAVSLLSRASVQRLAQQGGVEAIDRRRFRMLIEIDGVPAHAEDRWVGRRIRVGDALLRPRGHVGRCLITARDPDSGETTLPTLDLLRDYRGEEDSSEPLPLGVYGEVLEPGTVRVGDGVWIEAEGAR